MSEKPPKLDTALIRELAAILRDGDLGEIEVEHGELRIRVSRNDGQVMQAAPAQYYAPPPAARAPEAAPAAAAAPATAPAAPVADASHPGLVKSPMVGTAYLTPDPDSPAFVKEGDTVTEGQTLLLVEAMKTFNPVTAHKAGKVKSILVGNEQPVEFGEPLVIIE